MVVTALSKQEDVTRGVLAAVHPGGRFRPRGAQPSRSLLSRLGGGSRRRLRRSEHETALRAGSRAASEDAGGIRVEASVVRSRQAERHSGCPIWGREGPDWPDDVASAEPTRPGVGRVSDACEPSNCP